ncbi:MAG TPA: hypothetical protein VN871_03815, partial [Mycobacterium sp.]|nr:hypothetical protein [Mycobacterium sp.]
GGQRIVTADNDVMLHSLIRHWGVPDCHRAGDCARVGTRFADAVTKPGYTTVLPHPAPTLNFAGTEYDSPRTNETEW